MRIAPPSLPPHHSGPATRDFQSSISVEALFHRCHLDVQGLLHQQGQELLVKEALHIQMHPKYKLSGVVAGHFILSITDGDNCSHIEMG